MANTRRENRLEELGRVDAEHADTAKGKRNLKDEKKRIRKELQDDGSPHTKDRKRSPKRKLITGYGSQGQSSKPVEEPRKIYQRGGRAKPWGHGPKPGSLEFFQSTTQTPKRKGKAKGGRVKSMGKATRGGGAAVK